MELERKKVLVVGLGKTGEAVARFLHERGARVKLSEKRAEQEIAAQAQDLKRLGIEIEAGGHILESFLEADLIVPSPGVPPISELKRAGAKGVEILSEVELASRFLKGKIIGITGSNGKSTTATLTHKILKEGGLEAYLAGNIGTPLISFVAGSRDSHFYVTEMSSFQLYYISTFHAPVSVFLNISANHLDWHSSFTDYFNTKKKLILSQKEDDQAVLNRDDSLTWSIKKEVRADVYGFSLKVRVSKGVYLEEGRIMLTGRQPRELMSTEEIPIPGAHNQENVMAAAQVGDILGIPLGQIRNSVRTFQGLEHRLEKVLTIRGIDFVNDSKATSVDATLKSILSFDKRAILILGGRDKGGDFRKLRNPIKKRVKRIILIGEAREKIGKALRGTVPIDAASNLKEAVSLGFSAASPGEMVLFAPGCASFDMFTNFEHRGRTFKQEVIKLSREQAAGND